MDAVEICGIFVSLDTRFVRQSAETSLMCFSFAGGSGVLSYEFKRVYPAATVYLNDRPDVLEVAREHFYKGNEHLNIKFLPGKFSQLTGHGPWSL